MWLLNFQVGKPVPVSWAAIFAEVSEWVLQR